MARLDLSTPCDLWQGNILWTGAGRVVGGPDNDRKAHRVAYEQAYGLIPAGLVIGHMCHVVAAEAGLCVGGNTDPHRRCVNVLHLQAMTIGELQLASPLTIGGHNARVTRCPQGHPLAKRDLLPSGLIRPCRICLRAKAKKRAAVLTPEQREARREGNRKRRAVLTPKQRETIRVYNRTYRKNRPVTPEQREVQSARDKRRYDAQTPEQRKAKLVYNRARRLEKDKR